MRAASSRSPSATTPSWSSSGKRGYEHEALYIEMLTRAGPHRRRDDPPRTPDARRAARRPRPRRWRRCAPATDVIFQGTFFDGRWRGHPDFLVRRDDRPSGPRVVELRRRRHQAREAGQGRRDPPDVRLRGPARRAPGHPAGDDLRGHGRPRAAPAPAGRLRRLLPVGQAAVRGAGVRDGARRRAGDVSRAGRPLPGVLVVDPVHGPAARGRPPVARCGRGADAAARARRGGRDDAGRRSRPSPRTGRSATSGRRILDRLRRQATLQRRAPRGGPGPVRADPAQPGRARQGPRRRCRRPRALDVFFDIEADPWALDDGLEYLFGWVERGPMASPSFHALWAHDRAQEKRMLEAFVDLVLERRERDPGMHVYHYGGYESGALKRLMQRHATREDEIDVLLRGHVLVNLYDHVVRQGVRAGVESYSIKKLETFYMPQREGGITAGRVLGRRVRALDGRAGSGDPRRDRRLQPRRLRLEPAAPRLARGPARRGARDAPEWYPDGIVPRPAWEDGAPRRRSRARRPRRGRARTRCATACPRTGSSARRRAGPLAARGAPRLASPRGEAAVVGSLPAASRRRSTTSSRTGPRSRSCASTRTSAGSSRVRAPPVPVRPGAGRQGRRGQVVHRAGAQTRMARAGTRRRSTVIDARPGARPIEPQAQRRRPPPRRADPDEAVRRQSRCARWRGSRTTSSRTGSTVPGRSGRRATCCCGGRPGSTASSAGAALAPDGAEHDARSRASRLALRPRRRRCCRSRDRPGPARRTPAARMILDLVEAGKRVGVTAQSHRVIANLLEAVPRRRRGGRPPSGSCRGATATTTQGDAFGIERIRERRCGRAALAGRDVGRRRRHVVAVGARGARRRRRRPVRRRGGPAVAGERVRRRGRGRVGRPARRSEPAAAGVARASTPKAPAASALEHLVGEARDDRRGSRALARDDVPPAPGGQRYISRRVLRGPAGDGPGDRAASA